MNLQVIAIGLFVGDTLSQKLERAMLLNQLSAVRASGEITRYLRDITPISSGFMRSSTRTWDFRRRGQWGFAFSVGFRKSDFSGRYFYPLAVTSGTGIYGKDMSPIKPRFSKRLAWESKGHWTSAKSVRGQRPKPILEATEKMGLRLLREHFCRSFIQAWRI